MRSGKEEGRGQGKGEDGLCEAGSCKISGSLGMPVCEGMIGGHRLEVLRDTGCSGVVVKKFVGRSSSRGERKSWHDR